MLPNGSELPVLYFAAMQIGLYTVAVNWHLVGPEVAYILADSGAKAFFAHERFAEVAAAAAEEAGFPAEGRFAVGAGEAAGESGGVPGFRPLAELGADGPAGRP